MTRSRAIKLAVDALTKAQKQYNVGHNEYLQRGSIFPFAERDHKKWQELEDAKEELIRVKEAGEQLHQMSMFAAQPTSSPLLQDVQEGANAD
jgi:hypothetical protein